MENANHNENHDILIAKLESIAERKAEADKNGKAVKSDGAELAKDIVNAMLYNPISAEWFKSELAKDVKERAACLVALKQYVSRAKTVVAAVQAGTIQYDGTQSIVTLYDEVKALEKTEKAGLAKLANIQSAEAAWNHRALMLGAKADSEKALAEFLAKALPEEIEAAQIQGKQALIEQEKAEQEKLEAENRAADVTKIKAFVEGLIETDKGLFDELADHMIRLMEKTRQAA